MLFKSSALIESPVLKQYSMDESSKLYLSEVFRQCIGKHEVSKSVFQHQSFLERKDVKSGCSLGP